VPGRVGGRPPTAVRARLQISFQVWAET
jgi:hypothetical protein